MFRVLDARRNSMTMQRENPVYYVSKRVSALKREESLFIDAVVVDERCRASGDDDNPASTFLNHESRC